MVIVVGFVGRGEEGRRVRHEGEDLGGAQALLIGEACLERERGGQLDLGQHVEQKQIAPDLATARLKLMELVL